MPVPALDGLPYIPSVIGYAKGRAIVGAPARAHFFLSPTEVLFGPARHLGGGQVTLGEKEHEPEVLVARLLEQAVAAAAVVANGTIDGVALSRAAWASPEARRALAEAAHRAGMNLVRTEVATTLAAIALHAERGTTGRMAFVDVGGWKIEATVVEIEAGVVRALGRGVDATIGANWLDGRLVKALVHQVAPNDERTLLGDRLCYAMLREQCESLRIRLSTETVASLALPFLVPMLGVKEAPEWRLQRTFLEQLTLPLLDAIRVVCAEAVEHAGVEPGQITDTFVLGGLAHMPAVRDAVSVFFGRPATARGDVDGLAARGAALAAEASLGLAKLKVVDDLDDRGVATEAAGWGRVIPPFVTPTPEPLIPSAMPAPAIETAHVLPATLPAAGVEASMPSPSGHDPYAVAKAIPPDHPPAKVHAVHVEAMSFSPPTHDGPALGKLPQSEEPPARDHAIAKEATRPPPPALVTTPRAEPAHPAPPPEPHVPAAMVESIHPTPPPRGRGHEQPLPSEGAIHNAQDPKGLASVPLEGALPLAPPLSMPVLLLAIGRRRSFSGQLKLRRENHETSVSIVRGGAAGTSLEMEQLRRSFEWQAGTYKITSEAPPARLVAMRQPMVSVVVHGIRSCLRTMDIRQVLDVLQPHLHEAPHVLPSRGALVPLLGLSPRELRFVEHVLDGGTSADEILRRGGIGRETAVHLMFVLQLFRALEWHSVENRPGESPADQLRLRARKLEKADHFEALGVHWSVSRAEIDRAFRQIEEEMRPGGHASQIEPKAAAQILARARLAHGAVAKEGDRHAYLLDIHPDLDFEAIESVAEDQNQWYAWRGAEEATLETARLKKELIDLSKLQHQPHPTKPGR